MSKSRLVTALDDKSTPKPTTDLTCTFPLREKYTHQDRIKEVIGDESVLSFSRRSGVSEAVIRSYIKDKRDPSLEKIKAIAAAAGVTIDWLATGRAPKYRKDWNADAPPPAAALDSELLIQALVDVALLEKENKITLAVEKRARIAALLYKNHIKGTRIERDSLRQIIELAA
jgi:transcriptional regulator with XRE-family HTH domain